MTDVFISYSRQDRDKAAKLAQALESRLISVWWDTELVAQDSFRAEIERAIAAASAVLVLWSESARDSRFVNDEAHTAQQAGKLIQVTLDGAPPPMGFGGAYEHIVDLSGWNGDTDAPAFAGLLTAVQRLLPGRSEIAGLKAEVAALRAEMAQAPQSGGGKMAPVALVVGLAALALSLALAYSVWGGRQTDQQIVSSNGSGDDVATLLQTAATLPMTPDEAVAKTGEWLAGWNENYGPREFQQFFIFPKGNENVAAGAIVTGRKYEPWGAEFWDMQYGYHAKTNVNAHRIEGHEVTYLGPFWQPWYKDLSDTLNALKGGRKLKEFKAAPGG